MSRVIEIRSYSLKPGSTAQFERIVNSRARPMLESHGTDVVAACASLAEENSYCLIRAYANVAERDASQAAFYGSAAWREGPRKTVLACIENYTTIMIEADEATIDGLRDRARSSPRRD